MRNITIRTDEETARWARIWAAKHDTSLSSLLGKHLKRIRVEEEGYESIAARLKSKQPRHLQESEQTLPTRESLHER